MTDEAETTEPTAEAPAQSHAERAKKPPVAIDDLDHGIRLKVWPKTGSRGDYHEMAIERGRKTGPGPKDWTTDTVHIHNESLPTLIEKFLARKAEFIDQDQPQQAPGRSR